MIETTTSLQALQSIYPFLIVSNPKYNMQQTKRNYQIIK